MQIWSFNDWSIKVTDANKLNNNYFNWINRSLVNIKILLHEYLVNLFSLLPNSSFISAQSSFPDPIKCAALIIGISKGNSLISLSSDAARIDTAAARKKMREWGREWVCEWERRRGERERTSPQTKNQQVDNQFSYLSWHLLLCTSVRSQCHRYELTTDRGKKFLSDDTNSTMCGFAENAGISIAQPLYQNYFAVFDFSSPSIFPGLTANAIMQLRRAPGSGGYTDRPARRIRHK